MIRDSGGAQSGLNKSWSCFYCLVAKSCPTLCDPTDCSPPGSSIHGILQVRILEWVAISSSRGSSRPRDQTRVSCISCTVGRFCNAEPPGKPQISHGIIYIWNLKKRYKWTYFQNRYRGTDLENEHMVTGGRVVGRDRLGVWDWCVHTIIHKTDNR